jgi:hypothetical protein
LSPPKKWACQPGASLILDDPNTRDHITPILYGIGGIQITITCKEVHRHEISDHHQSHHQPAADHH